MENLDSYAGQPVEHVKMVMPAWRRASDMFFEDDLDFSSGGGNADKAAPFEAVGISENEFAESLMRKRRVECRKVGSPDLSEGDIIEIKFAIPEQRGGSIPPHKVSILMQIDRVREAGIYGHIFRMLPREEGGVTIEKLSNSSKILTPIYQGGRRDVMESFGDWIRTTRLPEKYIEKLFVYKPKLPERISLIVSRMGFAVSKLLSR